MRHGKVMRRLRMSGCGSAWLERLVWDQEVAGSNPVTPTAKAAFDVSRIGGRYCFFVKKYVNVERGGLRRWLCPKKFVTLQELNIHRKKHLD